MPSTFVLESTALVCGRNLLSDMAHQFALWYPESGRSRGIWRLETDRLEIPDLGRPGSCYTAATHMLEGGANI